jgi:hypothetical protein
MVEKTSIFLAQAKSELNNTLLEQQREIEKLMKDIKKGEKKRKEQEDELARLRAEHQQQQQQQQQQPPLDSARSTMSSAMPDTSRTALSTYCAQLSLPFYVACLRSKLSLHSPASKCAFPCRQSCSR